MFPARAGVILKAAESALEKAHVPRTRGGDPSPRQQRKVEF